MRALFVRIMNARRTTRWLSGIPFFLALRALATDGTCPWKNKAAFLVSQGGMLWWTTLDHYRWLQEIGWVSGDSKETKRFSFKGFVAASLASSLYFGNELHAEYAKKEDKDEKKLFSLRLNFVKHLLTLVSTLHISELYLSSEHVCGFFGMIASMIDIYTLYPRLPTNKDA